MNQVCTIVIEIKFHAHRIDHTYFTEIVNIVGTKRLTPFRPTFDNNICPADVENLIKDCWEQNPSDRPSIKDLMSELDRTTKSRYKVHSV